MALTPIPEIVKDIKEGKFIILVDDEDRENEGDLIMAAEKVTPESINFMTKNARGLICMPIIGSRLEELHIPMMVEENTARHGTAFTVSVDAKIRGATTGISAYDRAVTVAAMIDPTTKPEDMGRPGHIFPIRAREGGVLVRAGHTEATVDLARMAGMYPAGVLCEIMNEDGSMARLPHLLKISQKLGVKIASIADLIAYRRRHEKLVHKVAEAVLPTKYGEFTAIAYKILRPVENMLGGLAVVRYVHHIFTWFFILFIVVHIYMAFWYDAILKKGTVSSMISGNIFKKVK